MKEEYIKALNKVGVDKEKCRFVFKEKGLYGEPELWIYPIETGNHGTLVTKETIEDLEYLKEYLSDFINPFTNQHRRRQ